MKISDLQALVAKFGAADIPEFFNKYVKRVVQSNSIPIEVNTDFDYKKKEPIGSIYQCLEVVDDSLLRFVPTFDYFNARWFTSLYADIDHIITIITFDQKKNPVRQELEDKLKTEIAEGKFVNRDTGRIIGADQVDEIRTYPSEKE